MTTQGDTECKKRMDSGSGEADSDVTEGRKKARILYSKPHKDEHGNNDEDLTMNPGDYAQRFSKTVMNGFVAIEISLGHSLGLFEALKKFKHPVTSQELADSLNFKERYVREWLGCLSAAKFVCITEGDKYFIPEACKPFISETGFLATMIPNLAANIPDVKECFKKDGPKGYDYSDQMDDLMWLHQEKSACTGKWIDDNLFPTGKKDKDTVLNILDFGCATGSLTINIANHFSNAKVYGVDIVEQAIERANEDKIKQNVPNVEFYVPKDGKMDASWEKKFDWICMVDVLHDLPDPETVMKEIKRVLKDDGIISAVDPPVHSDQKQNVGDPRSAMLYVFSTFLCLPSSMSAEPSVGHGVGWGMERKVAFLKSMGFKIVGDEDNNLIHLTKA